MFGGATGRGASAVQEKQDEPLDLSSIFHRLNNQLGIILANAELLEKKAADEMSRARASQVAASALEALGIAKQLRTLLESGRK
jgi:hypothetical protein